VGELLRDPGVLAGRVRAQVQICFSPPTHQYLRAALAPLAYIDEQPSARADPVADACRTADATAEAARPARARQPFRSFRTGAA
jgi:hypothetical protein